MAQNSLTRKYEKDLKGLREILEIPQSYKMGNIDQKVLNPAIKEIQLKTKIRNIKINKIKIAVMNIFADLVYFILNANQIKNILPII